MPGPVVSQALALVRQRPDLVLAELRQIVRPGHHAARARGLPGEDPTEADEDLDEDDDELGAAP